MNYVAEIVADLKVDLDDCPDDLLAVYALLVLMKGFFTDLEDVHDAWSVWRNQSNPAHKSLVPFDQLTPEVQALDEKYANAIRAASMKYLKRISNG